MRCILSPDGTADEALVVVVLAVVPAVPFFAEVWVLECVDVGDMDTLSWFEVMEAMCSVWGVADEVGDVYRGGWSVLISIDFVLVQFVGYLPTSYVGVAKLDLC
jgi:hypothetical protein